MTLQRVSTGAPWERAVGYCRAVRGGDHVHVSGTVALNADRTPHAPGDMYAQTLRALETILGALRELGAGVEHVVRTRVYVTDISRWEEVGRAHGQIFGDHPPASTMVEVRALMDPLFLVEVEADAFVGG
jgi:enamine deaminase RidA (YjgF/YER057c/UK114 family)